MNEPAFNTLQSPPLENPKKPVLGILSCVAGILSILLFCGMFVLVYSIAGQSGFDPTQMNYEALTNLGLGVIALGGLSIFISLIGLILGVVGVIQKNTPKAWAIIGLVLNILILVGYCAFFSLSIIAYSTIGAAT